MKKLIIFSLLVLFFASCQKGISWDDLNSTGGSANGKRIVKLIQKSGSDSAIENYSYNAANSLIEYSAVQTISGASADADIKFVRNSSNIITKSITTSNQLTQVGISDITTSYVYDAASSRYKYSITSVTLSGVSYKDSIVYSYDAANRFINYLEYADNGVGYDLNSKEDYTYTGNNVSSAKLYSYDPATTSYTLEETDNFEFDAKTNPFQFTADAVPLRVMDIYSTFYSANNLTKRTKVTTSPSATTVTTATYTYNSNNMPATAVLSNGTSTANLNYFYQ